VVSPFLLLALPPHAALVVVRLLPTIDAEDAVRLLHAIEDVDLLLHAIEDIVLAPQDVNAVNVHDTLALASVWIFNAEIVATEVDANFLMKMVAEDVMKNIAPKVEAEHEVLLALVVKMTENIVEAQAVPMVVKISAPDRRINHFNNNKKTKTL